jgi:hypothetical protein
MALYILEPGIQPLGQFDLLDTDASSVVGGLIGIMSRTNRTNTSTETAAADVFDGYVSASVSEGLNTQTRPVVQIADASASDNSKGMYLMDDGLAGYGTLFGSMGGMFNPAGTALGPSTVTGSGKVTLWDKPGLYAASFEACYSATAAQNLGNGTLAATGDTPLPGDLLYRHYTTGKLCRLAVATSPTLNKIGVYVQHANSGSLVTTPAKLVGATEAFDRVVFNYFGFDKNL